MKRVIVRYRVKPECAEENRAYVEKVYAELNQTQPAGLRYATFRASDGVTHFHIAAVDTADGQNPLNQSPAFAAFSAAVRDRCDEPPVAMEVEELGSYNFI
jgi:quinol monooxygenase YgiN